MKRVIVLIALVLFCLPMAVQAESLRLRWDFPEATTDGSFSIYERTASGKVAVLEDIAVVDRESTFTATLPTDGSCRTYFMEYALSATVHGDPSLAVGWCPDGSLPDQVVKPGNILNLRVEILSTE